MVDVSRNVVAALLVLVIVVSGLGTVHWLQQNDDGSLHNVEGGSSAAVALQVPRNEAGSTVQLTVGDSNG